MKITQFHRKYLMLLVGNLTKMQSSGYDNQKRRIKDWNWQTKSFALMTCATIPGDPFDRVTSQNGDRVNFERLETPRPAPKVTLKRNWQIQQQQQHSSSGTDVPSTVKREAKRGGPAWSTRHHRSGRSTWKREAYHFERGCGHSSRQRRSQHECHFYRPKL